MKQLNLLVLVLCMFSSLSACVVERRPAHPPGCRHAVWVGGRHHGHWECERPRHRHGVIIVH